MNDELDVVGIGNALVDVLVEADVSLIDACGLTKGSMALMDLVNAERIHAQVGAGLERSGGSAANTIAGLASLGSRTGFIGRVADDALGRSFAEDITGLGVAFSSPGSRSRSQVAATGTGRCLILVTPDADRTMCTSLGISASFDSKDIDADLLGRAKVTYLEGYLFDLPPAKDAFRGAIKISHDAGRRVAMSLSDPFCVERHRDDFSELVDGPIDLLFGNADEVRSLTGTEDLAAACERLRRPGLTVTVTLGADGAVVFDEHTDVVRVPASPVPSVVDTTGAGDLYAAGFLHGFTTGLPLERCAHLGAVAAAECIAHIGARPQVDLSALAARLG